MVRNGHSIILFPKWLLSNITYGTKWLWCKKHMVRNGFWLWYEIAQFCGTKWYNMVRNGNGTKWFKLRSAHYPQLVSSVIDKPRVSPLLSLNTSAVIRYLICVYASHFFAGRPYHFNQTLRTANKF